MSRMDYNDDRKNKITTTTPIINNQTSNNNNRRRLKKCITYSCGSNVDGRLGLGGDHDESCRTVLTPLPPFQRRRRRRRIGRREDMTAEEEMPDDVDNEEDVIDDDDEDGDGGTNSIVMSSGRAHTLLCDDGIVYSWGANDWGQLGFDPDGDDDDDDDDGKACFQPHCITSLVNDEEEREFYSYPSQDEEKEEDEGSGTGEVKKRESSMVARDVFSGVRIVTLACGYNHSLIISSTGQLYSFGSNTHGELGHGDTISRWRPSPLSPPPHTSSFTIVAAAGGLHHSLILTIKGVVYAFGRGQEGQLGDGCCSISFCSSHTTTAIIPNHKSTKPQKTITTNTDGTATMDNEKVLLIAASRGGHGSYAVTLSGRGWYWGVIASDNFDVIDRPTALPPPLGSSSSSLPHGIHAGSGPSSTTTLHHTTSSPTTTQTIFATLSKTPPTLHHHHKPLHLSTPTSSCHRIISLSAGHSHAIFITLSGEAFSIGNPGPHLGLGPGNSFIWKTPSRCLLPGAVLVNGVCCGVEHTVLSTTCGRVYMCGDGRWGKLGLEGEEVLEVAGGREGVAREVELSGGDGDGEEEGGRVGVSEFGGEGFYGYHKIVGRLVERKGEDEEEDEEEMAVVARVISDVDIDDYEIPRDVKEEDNDADDIDDEDDENDENDAKEDFESFEDDEDYWGEDGLGHELELDFNLGSVVSSSNPFGTTPDSSCGGMSGSWKSRLGSETTRRLSRSTRAVGGVLYNTGGAVISAVKNRVRGESISSESTDGMATTQTTTTATTTTTSRTIPIQSSSSGTDKEKGRFVVGSLDSHQDSFNGLAGKASRKILLSAGLCHTCVRVLDCVDD